MRIHQGNRRRFGRLTSHDPQITINQYVFGVFTKTMHIVNFMYWKLIVLLFNSCSIYRNKLRRYCKKKIICCRCKCSKADVLLIDLFLYLSILKIFEQFGSGISSLSPRSIYFSWSNNTKGVCWSGEKHFSARCAIFRRRKCRRYRWIYMEIWSNCSINHIFFLKSSN